ncbi:chemotaxis protein CheW [Siminovitchia sp. 179-K 8D1 HS]|uniref:chemotaxis protein CheW n=1 Tax=Siminovitchia sp. 179-K 8D1 HS TaxID=3142385 RepID=UPI00399EFDDC
MNSTNGQYVVFTINDKHFGISIQDVHEITRMRTVKWVPNSKEEFLGVIHFREKVIPIISLHRMFLERENELESKTRVIVLNNDYQDIGFVVDDVDQVKFLPEEYITPAPHSSQSEWIKGVYHHGHETITLLNLKSLLSKADVRKVME